MPVNIESLLKLIEGSGLVKKADLDDANKVAPHLGWDVSDVLIGRNLITEDDYGKILSYHFGISFVNLNNIDIQHEVISLIPEDMAAERMAVIFENKNGILGVAMQAPQDLETIETIKKTVGPQYKIVNYVATSTGLKNALKSYKQRVVNVQAGGAVKVEDIGLSAIALVEDFLEYAVREEASDIHIEPMPEHILVRVRVDGVLNDYKVLSINQHSPITARIKILSNLKTEDQKAVGKILQRTHGMFLVTGPTGSGKTTTLYTVLGLLNRPDVNIVTIEDPVENRILRVNQTQVNADINLTLATGLRSILRQDPDIVMVGEIRDKETAVIAINAAMTGHLVFSSVHANTAAGAIPRMLDLGCEPFLLASPLNMIVAQRLVRILCPTC